MLTDLPNLLTLSRIAAIPVLVLLVALHSPVMDFAACAVFSAAAITDYFDGRIARGRRQISDVGRMLDPIADKLLVGATLMLLAGDDSAVLLHLQFLPVSLIGEAMLWAAAGLTLWTGWDYLTASLRHAALPRGAVRRP